jgi:dTMP kinase
MFITLEGPEGSGKTSQLPALAEYLRASGYDVVVTREPGGTPVGDQIREILMNLQNVSIIPRTEILLFLAARAQHVEELIRPALAAGKGCAVRPLMAIPPWLTRALVINGPGNAANPA